MPALLKSHPLLILQAAISLSAGANAQQTITAITTFDVDVTPTNTVRSYTSRPSGGSSYNVQTTYGGLETRIGVLTAGGRTYAPVVGNANSRATTRRAGGAATFNTIWNHNPRTTATTQGDRTVSGEYERSMSNLFSSNNLTERNGKPVCEY